MQHHALIEIKGETVGRKKKKIKTKKSRMQQNAVGWSWLYRCILRVLFFPDHHDFRFQLASSSERFQLRRLLDFLLVGFTWLHRI